MAHLQSCTGSGALGRGGANASTFDRAPKRKAAQPVIRAEFYIARSEKKKSQPHLISHISTRSKLLEHR